MVQRTLVEVVLVHLTSIGIIVAVRVDVVGMDAKKTSLHKAALMECQIANGFSIKTFYLSKPSEIKGLETLRGYPVGE